MAQDIENLKDGALQTLRSFIESQDEKHKKILSYWIQDYVRFLVKEESFDPKKIIRYKRGSIVKAHLGYRIGSEEGGLHYAVVLDMHNAHSSQTVTIVPLTSVKPHTDISQLHPSKLYIGNEIYQRLNEKAERMNRKLLADYALVTKKIDALEDSKPSVESPEYSEWEKHAEEVLNEIASRTEEMNRRIAHLRQVRTEVQRMKTGSIALVGQITTISKIRIYDPLYPSDTLSNIRLSSDSLSQLDDKLKELFTYKK